MFFRYNSSASTLNNARFESRFKKSFDFRPSEWFHGQRAYPYDDYSLESYHKAILVKERMEVSGDAISSAAWEAVGPSNIGGRITALVIDPADTNTIVLGAAAGGIFKSTNGGATWMPKTDQWKSLSIGAWRWTTTIQISSIVEPVKRTSVPILMPDLEC
ncbi:MAG: hypothetical protein IPJ75_16265 [Ignavibacteriales bacterium]|nr:hypothetical protein [Ignavibacteriales bacterium]